MSSLHHARGTFLREHVPRIQTTELREIPFPRGKLATIVNDFNAADKVSLQHMVLYSANIRSIDEFKHVARDGLLAVSVGDTRVAMYHLGLMAELSGVEFCNGAFTLRIPSDFTIGDIEWRAVRDPVRIWIHIPHTGGDTPVFSRVRIFAKYIYLEKEERLHLAQNSQTVFIQQLRHDATLRWRSGAVKSNTVSLNLSSHIIPKGYFFMGNVADIQHLKLTFIDQVRMDYDDVMLRTFMHKISDNLYYLSFTGDNNYRDCTAESYIGAPDYSRLVTVTMELRIAPMNAPLSIYSIFMNTLTYSHHSVVVGNTEPVVPPAEPAGKWTVEYGSDAAVAVPDV
jgi:hypothetical protein